MTQRDLIAEIHAVACPSCKAPAGQACVDRPTSHAHIKRRQAAAPINWDAVDGSGCICLDPGDAWGCPEHPKATGGVVTNPPVIGEGGCIVPTWRLEGTREISDAEREAFARVEHMLQPIDPNRPPVHIRDLTHPAA